MSNVPRSEEPTRAAQRFRPQNGTLAKTPNQFMTQLSQLIEEIQCDCVCFR